MYNIDDYENISKKEKLKFNKWLITEYPFLNYSSSEYVEYISEEEHDEYLQHTWYDCIPKGWRISFGKFLIDEIKDELIKFDYLDKFKIEDIKEKYGELRIYCNSPVGSKIDTIIDKYSLLSGNICISCGKPDVPHTTRGWILPICEDCFLKDGYHSKEEYLNETKNSSNIMSDYLEYTKYIDGSKINVTIDISDTANKIRNYWRDRV